MRRIWLIVLLAAACSARAGIPDDQLLGSDEVRKHLSDRAVEELKKEARAGMGDLAKRIFDYEQKKKEMQELIQKGIDGYEKAVKTARAIRDMLHATNGYRFEVAKKGLAKISASKVVSRTPIGFLVSVAANVVDKFTDIEKSDYDEGFPDEVKNSASFQFAHVFLDASDVATREVVKRIDEYTEDFGLSLTQLAESYQKGSDEAAKRAGNQIVDRKKLEAKLRSLAEAAKKKLEAAVDKAGKADKLQGETDEAVGKLRAARDKVGQAEQAVGKLEGDRAALSLRRQRILAQVRTGDEKASEQLPEVENAIANLDGKLSKARGELEDAKTGASKAYEDFSRRYDDSAEARRIKDVLDKARETGEAALESAGLNPRELEDLVRRAAGEIEKVREQIKYWEKKAAQLNHLIDRGKQLVQLAQGFSGMAQKMKERKDQMAKLMSALNSGEIKLADLRDIEEAAISFVKGEFRHMPDRVSAAVASIKGLEVERLDEIFREKLDKELEFFKDVPSVKIQRLRKRLLDSASAFGRGFKEWDRFAWVVSGLQEKIRQVEGAFGSKAAQEILENLDFNKKYDTLFGKIQDGGKQFAKKMVGKLGDVSKIQGIAMAVCEWVATWDLDEPTMTWVKPGHGDTLYYHEKPMTLELDCRDKHSGVNPNPDYWDFKIDGQPVKPDAGVPMIGFEPSPDRKHRQTFHFLETRYRVGRAKIRMKAPDIKTFSERHTLEGHVRDRAGHPTEKISQVFNTVYEPDPPKITILEPRSDIEAAKPGGSVEIRVLIQAPISRVRAKDVVITVMSVDDPEDFHDYLGLDREVQVKPRGGSAHYDDDDSYTEMELTVTAPELKEGLYLVRVMAVNGAAMQHGIDKSFFVGDKYNDVRVVGLVEPLDEKVVIGFQAQNFSLMDVEGVEVSGPAELPSPPFTKKPGSPDTLAIERIPARAPTSEGKSQVVTVTSREVQKFDVAAAEPKTYNFKYQFTVLRDGKRDEPKTIIVPVSTGMTRANKEYLKGRALYGVPREALALAQPEAATENVTAAAPAGFLPVPRGTRITINQIFGLPGIDGKLRTVEQAIGHGWVKDNEGGFQVQVTVQRGPGPKARPIHYRFRVVAETTALDVDAYYTSGLQRDPPPVAIVSMPLRKSPYRCISQAFSTGDPVDNNGRQFYDAGDVEIPYHPHPKDAKAKRGIKIPWEGDLSTGGLISTGSESMLGHMQGGTPFQLSDWRTYQAEVIPGLESNAGILWINFNEALFILDAAVKGHTFARTMIREFEKIPDWKTEGTFIPILTSTFEPPPGPPDKPKPKPWRWPWIWPPRIGIETETEIEAGIDIEERIEPIPPDPPIRDLPPTTDPVSMTIVDPPRPKKKKKKVPVQLTLVPEENASKVTEWWGLHLGVNWQYAPDDPAFKPVAARHLADDRYLVVDAGKGRVLLIEENRTISHEVSQATDSNGVIHTLAGPRGAWSLGDNDVLVSDTGHDRVLEIDGDKRVVWSYGGGAKSPIKAPTQVQRLGNDHTLILDSGHKRLVEVDSDGKEVRSYGKKQGLTDPVHFFLQKRKLGDRLWVSDRAGKIVALAKGKPEITITAITGTDADGKPFTSDLGEPGAVFVNENEHVLACRPAAGEVVSMTVDGRILGRIEKLAVPADVSQKTVKIKPADRSYEKVPLSYIALWNPKEPEPPIEEDDDDWLKDLMEWRTIKYDLWVKERTRIKLKIEQGEIKWAKVQEKKDQERKDLARVQATVALAERKTTPPVRRPDKKIDINGLIFYYPYIGRAGSDETKVKYPHFFGYPWNKSKVESFAVYVDRDFEWKQDQILRAYGHFIRMHVFELWGVRDKDKKKEPPVAHANYQGDKRHGADPAGLRDAWNQGWDHFFSYAVRKSMAMPTLKDDASGEPWPLAKAFDDYLKEVLLEDETGKYEWLDKLAEKPFRGLNNELAWSMIMYRLWEIYGDLFLTNLRSYAKHAGHQGHLYKYMPIGLIAEIFPDQLREYLALGLLPVLRLETASGPVADIQSAQPKISWHTNGLLGASGDLSFTLEYAADPKFERPRAIQLQRGKNEFDFGRVLSDSDLKLKLENRLYTGTWYFRIRAEGAAFPDVGAVHGASSPIGALRLVIPEETVTVVGANIPFGDTLGVKGKVSIPAGAISSSTPVSVQPLPIATGATDEPIVGDTAYDFSPHGMKFKNIATMEFDYDRKKIHGLPDKAVVVKRWDEARQRWVSLPTQVDPATGKAQGKTGTFSVYALMVETRPPRFVTLRDRADPLGDAGDSSLITIEATENGTADVDVLDAGGRVVRALAREQEYTDLVVRAVWDLADDAGKRVPDGVYTVRARLKGFGGQRSEPRTCTVRVAAKRDASLAGLVKLADRADARGATVSVDDTTCEATSDGAGRFTVRGLVDGTYDLLVRAPGYYPLRVRTVAVRGTTSTPAPLALDHRIARNVRVGPPRITPGPDGLDPETTLTYALDRPAYVTVDVLSPDGKVVRTLESDAAKQAGPVTHVWDGKDAKQDVVQTGTYTLQMRARVEDVTLVQLSQAVKVDAGLAREIFAQPVIFSPNDDGVEDATEIGYRMMATGTVSVTITDAAGTLVRTLVAGNPSQPGLYGDRWDGTDDQGKPLPDGRYRFHLATRYADGTPSTARQSLLIVDRIAPKLTGMRPANGSKLTTTMPEILCTVSASRGDVTTPDLRLHIDHQPVPVDRYDPASGLVTFRPRTSLGEGTHVAVLYANDQAGNEAPPAAVSFSVDLSPGQDKDLKRLPFRDTEAPRMTALTPPTGMTVYSATPLMGCRLFDEHSGIDPTSLTFWLDGEKVANQVTYYIPGRSGEDWDWWQYQRDIILYDPLTGWLRYLPSEPIREAEGEHNFKIEARDRAGNSVASPLVRFKVVLDKKPPRVASLSPADGALYVDGPREVRARVADEGGAGVELIGVRLAIDGRPVDPAAIALDEKTGELLYPLSEPLEDDAEHLVSLIVRDRAGNTSEEAHATFVCRADRQPPVLVSSDPPDGGAVPSTRDRFVLRLADLGSAGLDGARVHVTLDGATVLPGGQGTRFALTDEAEGSARIARVEVLVPPGLPVGEHVLIAEAADRAGNRAAPMVVRVRSVADTSPPEIVAMTPGHASLVASEAIDVRAQLVDVGSGIDPRGIQLRLDGELQPVPEDAYDPARGELAVRIDPGQPLPPGSSHLVTLIVTDRAGQASKPWVSVVRTE